MLTLPKSDPHSAEECAHTMLDGGVVIIPTDTVYGLSALAVSPFSQDDEYASAIRAIKGRDAQKPFIVLIAEPSAVAQYTDDGIPQSLLSLWPGALTIIANSPHHAARRSPLSSASTIALRCPGDEWLRRVITLCGTPIYSTSANISGTPPLGTIKDICTSFSSTPVSLAITDGDKTAKPSTIVRVENDTITVLRQGSIFIGGTDTKKPR